MKGSARSNFPVEKDSTNGSQMLVYFAIVAAWVGEKDTALQYLAARTIKEDAKVRAGVVGCASYQRIIVIRRRKH